MEEIQRLVIQRKIDTGGNYDGVVGYVKNFNYTARPDGGFDCTTELTGIGETIEALKGRADIYSTEEGIFTTALEEFLKSILAFSVYADRNTIDADEEQKLFQQVKRFLVMNLQLVYLTI
jgi:6-phosphogluconolactonase (cycloisomerase 2 family)